MFLLCLATAAILPAFSQDARYDSFYTNSLYTANWNKLSSNQKFEAIRFTTSAYKKEAFSLVLKEANRVAKNLKLEDKLPLTESNVAAVFIGPPIMEIKGQGIGNVSTTNYTYYVEAIERRIAQIGGQG